MADIVINHRVGSTRGAGGLYNRYDGLSVPWDERAVTSDTGGHGNPSTGEAFSGVSNIDHTQEFVRNDLKKWLKWIRDDIGFDDFRFDFAKGYKPEFVKGYIKAAEPDFTVGEYWDTCSYVGSGTELDYNQDHHRQRIINWIDRTGGLAAAFDFTTKAILQEAVKRREWWRLRDSEGRPPGVMGMWPSRAVTFVENHDTGSTQAHWPFPSDLVMQGYAYTLTHPGIPIIFYDHFFDWGNAIQDGILKLMAVRKKQGLHSRSAIEILKANNAFYAAVIGGSVCVKIGDGFWKPDGINWELATWGDKYAVWQKVQP
eukprot:c28345_g1_i3 orf=72-1013(-)